MFIPTRSRLKSSQQLNYHFYILHYIAIVCGLSNLSYNHATQTIEMAKKKVTIRYLYYKTVIVIVVAGTLIYEYVFTVALIETFHSARTVKAQELMLWMLYFHLACISSLTMQYNLRVRRRVLVELLQRLSSLRWRLKYQCYQCWHDEKFYFVWIYLRWISVLIMLPNSNMVEILKSDSYFVFHGSYYIIIYEICYHAYFLHSFIVFCSYKILNKFLREKFHKRRYTDLAKVTKIYYCLDQVMHMGATFTPFLVCIFGRFVILAVELYQTLKCALYAPDLHTMLRLQKFGRVLPIILAQFLEVLLLSLINDDLLTEKQMFIDRLAFTSTKLVALRRSTKNAKKIEAEFDMTTLFSKLNAREISVYDTFTSSRSTILDFINIIASITIPSLQYFVSNCYSNSKIKGCNFKCVWGT